MDWKAELITELEDLAKSFKNSATVKYTGQQVHAVIYSRIDHNTRIRDADINTYGNHIIGQDWVKIDDVYIWFKALAPKNRLNWRGIRGYVYKKPDEKYVAPFRGDLIDVAMDTKDEFREL